MGRIPAKRARVRGSRWPPHHQGGHTRQAGAGGGGGLEFVERFLRRWASADFPGLGMWQSAPEIPLPAIEYEQSP
jgi:hypothetical protein